MRTWHACYGLIVVGVASKHWYGGNARMLLADEFYLIAHADTSGQLRLHPKVAGYGVAASLLGELVLMGRAEVDAGIVRVASAHPPQDVLAHTVLDLLLS